MLMPLSFSNASIQSPVMAASVDVSAITKPSSQNSPVLLNTAVTNGRAAAQANNNLQSYASSIRKAPTDGALQLRSKASLLEPGMMLFLQELSGDQESVAASTLYENSSNFDSAKQLSLLGQSQLA